MEIRLACEEDFETVKEFYAVTTDLMQEREHKAGWKKGIYPSYEFMKQTIATHTMYTGMLDGVCVAAAVLDHNTTEGYEKVAWAVDALPEEVSVIHALGIHPNYQRQGLSKKLVQALLDIARANGQKAVRLDVLHDNLPAHNLYKKMGFVYRDTLQLYYEDTGLTDFLLYEYVL